ncbi:MAG: potassium transporter Kef [Planctomycetota bacterium]|nr:MAG: potassium transporter Kef [Planctomycetota bacterium]
MRRWLYVQLESSAWPRSGISPCNAAVAALIGLSLLQQIVETEPLVVERWGWLLYRLEMALLVAFAVEYLLRLWVAGEDARFAGLGGRLRYALTPMALVDLVAILPSLILLGGTNLAWLRGLRVVRILRFARFGPFSLALQVLYEAFRIRRYELALSLALVCTLIVLAATGMYLIEGNAQPEVFGSIPRALWWSVVTMTTVGYGDAYPLTPAGRILGALVALAGVASIAIPTGILAGSFTEVLQRHREEGTRRL